MYCILASRLKRTLSIAKTNEVLKDDFDSLINRGHFQSSFRIIYVNDDYEHCKDMAEVFKEHHSGKFEDYKIEFYNTELNY